MIPTTEHLTANDLDAMPRGATVVDRDGDPWRKMADNRWDHQNSFKGDTAGAELLVASWSPLTAPTGPAA